MYFYLSNILNEWKTFYFKGIFLDYGFATFTTYVNILIILFPLLDFSSFFRLCYMEDCESCLCDMQNVDYSCMCLFHCELVRFRVGAVERCCQIKPLHESFHTLNLYYSCSILTSQYVTLLMCLTTISAWQWKCRYLKSSQTRGNNTHTCHILQATFHSSRP